MERLHLPNQPTSGLRLHPFRGLRYNSAQIADLGAVTSPPYDVMDRQMIEDLLERHPRNIVRLILPRLVAEPMHTDDPNVHAAKLLRRWVESGVLTPDPTPGLYVYEYGDTLTTICGLVGALELRSPAERTILPHEDVIGEIVADRLAMMSAAEANLEPILLVYDGAGATEEILTALRSTPPLVDVTSAEPASGSSGSRHRLWSVTDPAQLRRLQSMLAPHQALIADGHHRYASYLQMRSRARLAGRDYGPEERGLALLIDSSRYPLRLGAIHRTVAEAKLSSFSAPAGYRVLSSSVSGEPSQSLPESPRRFVLTDGRLAEILAAEVPEQQAVTDAELLHSDLLRHWAVGDDRLGYHHTAEQAVAAALREGGVAILLHPPPLEQVMQVAAGGASLPRKSTSFGPKPRTGLVMRRFVDEA